MAAYVIVDITVNDAVKYEEYKKLTPASIAAYGGRFIVRGGAVTVLEGDVRPGRTVLLEFPSAGAARSWWDGPEYREAKALRQSCATTRMILVEGI